MLSTFPYAAGAAAAASAPAAEAVAAAATAVAAATGAEAEADTGAASDAAAVSAAEAACIRGYSRGVGSFSITLLPACRVHTRGAPSAPPPVTYVESRRVGVTEAAPVVGMNTTLRQQLLERIITIIQRARPLVAAIERKDRDLSSQLKRSLNSTALNVAEAFGAHAGNARLSFRRALGELYESQASFEVAAAWGYITEEQAQALVLELAALGGRLYGLSRR